MADLNIGNNVVPKTTGTYNLGTSSLKWKIDASQLVGMIPGNIATLSSGTTSTTTAGKTYGVAAKTSSPYCASKWYAYLNNGITSLSDGMMITIKVPVAGNSTYGTMLTIDGGTSFHPVVTGVNSAIGTRYAVNSIITLVYNSVQAGTIYNASASASSVTGIWVVINDYDAASYCDTAAGTAAKTASHTNYYLRANSYTLVTMVNSNSYSGKITLNINSKGAKNIYINGTVSSSTNKTLPAGTYLVYYDGTNYYFRTDGKITGDITGKATSLSYNGTITNLADWDNVGSGIWAIAQDDDFSATYHQPVEGYTWGTLEVISNGSNIVQRYTPHYGGTVYFRARYSSNDSFSEWSKVVTTECVSNAGVVAAQASEPTNDNVKIWIKTS